MKKIGIIGHFSETYNDGQTVKTNEIYKELNKDSNYTIEKITTENCKKNLFNFFKNIYFLIKKNDYIVIIVASGGIKIVVPYVVFLNVFFKKKICYCAVGSWLDMIIARRPILKSLLKKIDKIFVETLDLKKKLEDKKFSNVEILYNFKYIDKYKKNNNRELNSFCIFSRIIEEKGIEDAIYAIKKLNSDGLNSRLYIYGPIGKEYESEFNNLIHNNPNVKYCGNVKPEKSGQYISKYWMLLFPTRFIKEGLPGTLIDAYNANTPVIASNWYSAEEFVPDIVGYRYKFGDRDSLYYIMKNCIKNHNDVEKKRENTIQFSKKFSPSVAIKPLKKFLK